MAANEVEDGDSSTDSEWPEEIDLTESHKPIWLLPWEQIMCYLSLKDLSSLIQANSHFSNLAGPRRLRFWQLYFSEISNAGYKKIFKMRFHRDMKRSRIALYWQRLVLAETHKSTGNALFAAGDFQGARRAFDQALKVTVLRPDKLTKQVASSILNNRAATCITMGDYAHAAFDAHHATKLRPNFLKAWINKGTALARLWYHRDATQAFKDAEDLEDEPALSRVVKLCKSYLDLPNPKHAIFRRSPLQPLLVESAESPANQVFLKAPASFTTGQGVAETKSEDHHQTNHYKFHGEVNEQNVWDFFEALQLRKVFTPAGEAGQEPSLLGFVLEPLELQFEMTTFNHRQEFTQSTHFWDMSWKCSTKRARQLFTLLKRAIENFDGDPGTAAPVLVRKIWESQPTMLKSSDNQWMFKQSVPGDKTDVEPFSFEIYASPYALDDEKSIAEKDRQTDTSSHVSLLVEGDLDCTWCKPASDSDDDTTDDSYDEENDPDNMDTPPRPPAKDEEDDEIPAIGKVLVEFVKEEETMETTVGRVLMKSLMALRDDSGLLFPRYAVVTNGLDWWFLKVGSRLHVYGVPFRLTIDDFAPEADELKKGSAIIRSLKGIMEWLYLFISMTVHDNVLSESNLYDSEMRKLSKTWFGV